MNNTVVSSLELGRRFLDDNEALIIFGSVNPNSNDRVGSAGGLCAVQVLTNDEFRHACAFDGLGKFGVSSAAFHPSSNCVFVATETEVWRIDLPTRHAKRLALDGLKDVHEISLEGDVLAIANSGSDEVLLVDITRMPIYVNRIALERFREPRRFESVSSRQKAASQVRDRFHCNQAFVTGDGAYLALVHHVSGWQALRQVSKQLLKSQGDGGLVNVSTGDRMDLGLRAPHSARFVSGKWWILDSGRSLLNGYNSEWEVQRTVELSGWGRGAAVTEAGNFVFVGISPVRDRYLSVTPRGRQLSSVDAVDVQDGRVRISAAIPFVEQLNNLYVVDRAIADALCENIEFVQ